MEETHDLTSVLHCSWTRPREFVVNSRMPSPATEVPAFTTKATVVRDPSPTATATSSYNPVTAQDSVTPAACCPKNIATYGGSAMRYDQLA